MCKGKLNVFGNIQQDTYKTDCVLSNKKKKMEVGRTVRALQRDL